MPLLYVAAFFPLLVAIYYLHSWPLRPFPPGPRGLPFIGAALSMPPEKEWLTYNRWSKKFGDLVGLTVFGQKIVILHTSALATELLETRGAMSSDRPRFPMIDLIGFSEWNIGLMQYGERLRISRKLLLQAMSPQKLKNHAHVQQREVYQLLANLLESPKLFPKHLKRTSGGIMLSIFIGHQVRSENDLYMTLNEEHDAASNRAGSPGLFLVNILPSLKYLPAWFPGGGFKYIAEEGRNLSQKVFQLPLQAVNKQIEDGTAVPCFMTSVLEDGKHIAEGQAVAATSYTAGAETTTATLETFILAMTLYPDAQRKAQAEIDQAIGTKRLPRPEDKDVLQLPFVEALIKETHRWNPPGHLGIPHRLMKDDTIEGYLLPRGTIIISNVWAILHNEKNYPRPFDFYPERYMGSVEQEDPRIHTFGYGRRVCPGRNLADTTLWLTIVSILSVFDITPDIDDKGNVIPITPQYTSGVVSRPKDFACRIKPRSKAGEDLVRHSLEYIQNS